MGTLIFNVALLVLKQFLLAKEAKDIYHKSFEDFLRNYSKDLAGRSAAGKERWLKLMDNLIAKK